MIVLELNSSDLNKINSVDLLVSKYYGCSLFEFCNRYKYDSFFIEVIKQVTKDFGYERLGRFEVILDDDNLEDKYYELEKKSNYGVDNRSVINKVISLGTSWVVEDIIVHKSSEVFILTGCDNTRDLLVNPVTNVPDIRYVGTGESYYVEICSDFTKFMQKNRRYDLRIVKYYKLQDLISIHNMRTILLFVDVVNGKYYRAWFTPQTRDKVAKYKANTVAFEFDSNVVFQDFWVLFENCKKCQPNPSLYSNFNIEETAKPKKKKWVEDIEDDGYWESLADSEPEYVKVRDVDDAEITGEYPEIDTLKDADFWTKVDSSYYERESVRKLKNWDEVAGLEERGIPKKSNFADLEEFEELPDNTKLPFDPGPEPPEKEYYDTSDNPFDPAYDPYSDGSPF